MKGTDGRMGVDDCITLKEYIEKWISHHQREHLLETIAVNKAAEALAIKLDYIEKEKARNSDRIDRLEKMWSNMEGRLWALGVFFVGMQFVAFLILKFWR